MRQKPMIRKMLIVFVFCGCSTSDKVNANITRQAQEFGCERRVTVYNARTDTVIFQIEGYKKNYVYLNDYTLYVVEDITVINPLPFTSGERHLPVCCLADSLKRMTTADVIFFAKDWEIASGCRVEQFVACHYMPQILRMYESKKNHREKEPFKCTTL